MMVAQSIRRLRRLLSYIVLMTLVSGGYPLAAQQPSLFGVQAFLDGQPGRLKQYRVGDRSVAALLEYYSLLNGLHPRLMLALLEATNGLISNPQPTAQQLAQPLSPAGPNGFVAQIAWGYAEIVAGIQPYSQAPTVTFSDGSQATIELNQSREGVAIQRFLSRGRTRAQWVAAVNAFTAAFRQYFNNQLPQLSPPLSTSRSTLQLSAPWPRGTRVEHLAYFDHQYPLIDSGGDGNRLMVDYRGRSTVQYNSHDGHDFTFPADPFGTPVLAAADGTAYARVDPLGRGWGVVILHGGGFETVYWHLGAFDAIFADRIDSNLGVTVSAGTRIGTSGASGIDAGGTPHLHFEVRRRDNSGLRQIDPFGWFGSTPDPCAGHPRCETLGWLWNGSASGIAPLIPPVDTVAPLATLQLAPADDLALYAAFDGNPLQTVGSGLPIGDWDLRFVSGRFAQGLQLSAGELRYPIDGAATAAAGSLTVWVQLPTGSTPPEQVLVSSSRGPWDAAGTPTLRLQRDRSAGRWQWAFVTVGPQGELHRLAVDDSGTAGWQRLGISWQVDGGIKQLTINGTVVATANAVVLPTQLGDELWLGRRGSGAAAGGLVIDELQLWRTPTAAAAAPAQAALNTATASVSSAEVLLDTNAYDPGGTVASLQIGVNGSFSARQAYGERFRVTLPAREGTSTVAVRYYDTSDNVSEVTRTVTLDQAPRGSFGYRADGGNRTRILVSAIDLHLPLQMQISTRADFSDAVWQPFMSDFQRSGAPPPQLYLRLRDANGNIGDPMLVTSDPQRVLLPVP